MTLRVLPPGEVPAPPSRFLGLLLSRPHPEIVASAVGALFSTEAAREPIADEVQATLKAWGYESKERSEAVRRIVLEDIIEETLQPEAGFDQPTLALIDEAADTLTLDGHTRRAVKESLAADMVHAAVDQALADKRLTAEERVALEQLADRLQVSSAQLTSLVQSRVQPLMDEITHEVLAHGRYSPEDEKQLKQFASDLGVTLSIDAGTSESLARMRRLWQIEQGMLPTIAPTISLKKGEILHFRGSAVWLELRTKTTRISYAGPTVSIRIMKGVRYRLGSFAPMRSTVTELTQIQSGTLYITNKRLLLDGTGGNKAVPWSAIFGSEVFADAIKFEKANGKDPYLRLDPSEVEEVALIVSAILNSTE